MSIQNQVYEAASHDLNAGVTGDVDAAIAAPAAGKTLRLIGFAATESAGIPALATLAIVNGATASGGDAVIPISLLSSTSQIVFFGDGGISFPNGISIDHIAGEFDCTLFYKITD